MAPDFLDSPERCEWRRSNSAGDVPPGSTVAPLGVIEHLDVVEDVGPGCISYRVDLPTNALPLSNRKKPSATAWSWQFPRRLMLETTLCSRRKGGFKLQVQHL